MKQRLNGNEGRKESELLVFAKIKDLSSYILLINGEPPVRIFIQGVQMFEHMSNRTSFMHIYNTTGYVYNTDGTSVTKEETINVLKDIWNLTKWNLDSINPKLISL